MKENIKQNLKLAGIPIERWGKDGAKKVEDLAREVREGESILKRERGGLTRGVRVACVDVFYKDEGKLLILREERQEFHDGRIRQRKPPTSVSEKIRTWEDPKAAAYRGVTEELGVRGSLFIADKGVTQEEKESLSYPGLITRFEYHRFKADLDKWQFQAAGYREEQRDKTTYFVWEEEK